MDIAKKTSAEMEEANNILTSDMSVDESEVVDLQVSFAKKLIYIEVEVVLKSRPKSL